MSGGTRAEMKAGMRAGMWTRIIVGRKAGGGCKASCLRISAFNTRPCTIRNSCHLFPDQLIDSSSDQRQ